MAHCSYDVHIQETFGSLLIGASVVLLRPHGHMSMDYLIKVLNDKQVTYMQSVPTYIENLADFLPQSQTSKLSFLRTLDIGGEY